MDIVPSTQVRFHASACSSVTLRVCVPVLTRAARRCRCGADVFVVLTSTAKRDHRHVPVSHEVPAECHRLRRASPAASRAGRPLPPNVAGFPFPVPCGPPPQARKARTPPHRDGAAHLRVHAVTKAQRAKGWDAVLIALIKDKHVCVSLARATRLLTLRHARFAPTLAPAGRRHRMGLRLFTLAASMSVVAVLVWNFGMP